MNTLDQLTSVRAFIDEHFDQPLSLDELAQRAYLSRYHFIRLFRRCFYETPHQYLTRKRIEKAKYLLAYSNLSVTDICFSVGFASMGSFSTLFHKTVGWSPSAYRARVWEQQRNPYRFIPGCFCTMYKLSPEPITNMAEQ
ncbi:MAG TPA: AraC family transcriptional regulator [Anaerolineae bacterium]|nr:AraC family transcriptional regulator [Anaerolineae bacterium]